MQRRVMPLLVVLMLLCAPTSDGLIVLNHTFGDGLQVSGLDLSTTAPTVVASLDTSPSSCCNMTGLFASRAFAGGIQSMTRVPGQLRWDQDVVGSVGGELVTLLSPVLAVDFDADGVADLAGMVKAVGGFSFELLVGIGDGKGSFSFTVVSDIFPLTPALDVADLDADGKLDVVRAGGAFGFVFVQRGNGTGTILPDFDTVYAAPPPPPPSPGMAVTLVAAGDYNGDGLIDCASKWSDGKVRAHMHIGGMLFSTSTVASLGSSTIVLTLLSADLDYDGTVDIVVPTTQGVHWMRGAPSWVSSVVAPAPLNQAIQSVSLVELDSDSNSRMELLMATTNGVVQVWYSDTDAAWMSSDVAVENGASVTGIAVGEFDDVPGLDVVMDSALPRTRVFYFQGAPSAAASSFRVVSHTADPLTGIFEMTVREELVVEVQLVQDDGAPCTYPIDGVLAIASTPAVGSMVFEPVVGAGPGTYRGSVRIPVAQRYEWNIVVFDLSGLSDTKLQTEVVMVCDAGFKVAGAVCEACPSGSYGTDGVSRLSECTACPAGTSSPGEASGLGNCSCVSGTWRPVEEQGTVAPCRACPAGAVCDGGQSSPVPLPGYTVDGAGAFRECPTQGCGPGGSCRGGYTGELCSGCADGWYASVDRAVCSGCPRGAGWIAVGVWAAGIVGAGTAGAVVLGWRGMPLYSSELALFAVQGSGLALHAGFGWSRGQRAVLAVLGAAAGDVNTLALACGYGSFLGAVVGQVALVCVCSAVYLGLIAGSRGPGGAAAAVPGLASVVLIPLTGYMAQVFACTELDNGTWVLRGDLGSVCGSSGWWAVAVVVALPVAGALAALCAWIGVRRDTLARRTLWRRPFLGGEAVWAAARVAVASAAVLLGPGHPWAYAGVAVLVLVVGANSVARWAPLAACHINTSAMWTAGASALVPFSGVIQSSDASQATKTTIFVGSTLLLAGTLLACVVWDVVSWARTHGKISQAAWHKTLAASVVSELADLDTAHDQLAAAADSLVGSLAGTDSRPLE